MWFDDHVIDSLRGALSHSQALELAGIYLADALNVKKDIVVSLMLCRNTEESLLLARKTAKRQASKELEEIGEVYGKLCHLVHSLGFQKKAQALYKKALKLG
jgi:hypothetical protein